jgi:hypothetical protein
MRWVGHVASMGARRLAHKVLVEKCEGKSLLGKCRNRFEDNTKMDLY